MKKFFDLSLVNKVCIELEQNLGTNVIFLPYILDIDAKEVAELILETLKKTENNVEQFVSNVHEIDDTFPTNLCHRIYKIYHMFKKSSVFTNSFSAKNRRPNPDKKIKQIIHESYAISTKFDNPSLLELDFDVEMSNITPSFLTNRQVNEIKPVVVCKSPEGQLAQAASKQGDFMKERKLIKKEKRLNDYKYNNRTPERNEKMYRTRPKVGLLRPETLPIFFLKKELLHAIESNKILVVVGETGSGKSTQMTQYLAEMGFDKNGVIGCTQPRRVAAVSIAKRVSKELGCRVGDRVGYSIRFEDCTSSRTKIKYMTDGVLKREYLADPNLSSYSVMILDEAHERTIDTDILFALLKKLTRKRENFKLIVTSATLDAEKFSKYFFDCPVFKIPGRTYPVEILYSNEPETDYVEAAIITVMQIHLSEPSGDILVFLTGQEEIETAIEIINHRMKSLGKSVPDLITLPAYGALPSQMQARIFEATPLGKRKCVVATNIAEASLTIDGIVYVVDPGFVKQKVYDSKLVMDLLQPVPISQASARQRAGRAGRTGPGKCYRLYTEKAFNEEMLATTIPEIQRTNLVNSVLQLKAMGISDLIDFDFMDSPPTKTLVAALRKLYALGALDDEGLLTKLGLQMSRFPLEPVLAKTLLTSSKLNCVEETVIIVSMLSIENPFYRPKHKQEKADRKKNQFINHKGDHLTLLTVYRAWERSGYSRNWCFGNFIQARSMEKAREIRKQLLEILLRYKISRSSCGKKYELVQQSFTAGFFMHAAKRDKKDSYRTVANDTLVHIHPSSSLFQKPCKFVLYHELLMTSKEYMRNVLVIEPQWLLQFAPTFYQKADLTKLSKRKRMEKIEPLHNKYEDKDSWRLSKRMC